MTTTRWAEERAQLEPIERRIRAVADRIDAGEGSADDEVELEDLRNERRAILDGDDINVADDRPTAAELRADLEFDVAYDRPRQRATDLQRQLNVDLEQERRELAAIQHEPSRRVGLNEQEIAWHRAAVARDARYARSLAEHEVGHAVCAEARGVPVKAVRYLYNEANGTLSGAQTEFERDFRDPVISAAGAAFAQVAGFHGRGSDDLSESDVLGMERAGIRRGDLHRQQLAVAAAADCLRQHWPAVQRIAAALLDAGYVSGDQVRAIIRETST